MKGIGPVPHGEVAETWRLNPRAPGPLVKFPVTVLRPSSVSKSEGIIVIEEQNKTEPNKTRSLTSENICLLTRDQGLGKISPGQAS